MEIGILGGTGPAGRAIAARLASVGFDVLLGSRNRYRAMEAADGLLLKWPDKSLSIRSADNAGAAGAGVVVIATPWDAAAETARSVAEHLCGKVVVCMSNAIARVAGEFQPLVPPRGSVAASVQAEIPDAYVAAAFHHVPATELGNLEHEIVSDILICSDHEVATGTVSEIVSRFPGSRPLDAGGLSNAMAIEAFTAVLLQLNSRYSTRVAVGLTGIGDA
ncbi:MAG: NADPH-dependent F420 reductase [Acidimicrobiia bacterium]|nr:NADPH-dependent F420 reductase [Actinomycetota bacterium]MBL6924893.1 NADPH-dependent F420 reductase [Acidimicrobiia bacterium]MBL6927061.1 NADPH-dependent F420 reductase [Acidimicrobiia bacterium]